MKNEKGFSIIEVLISTCIMTMNFYLMASFISKSALSQKSLEQQGEFQQFIQSVNAISLNPVTCTAALFGQPFDITGAPTNVVYHDAIGVITAGTPYHDLTMTRVQLLSEGLISGTTNQYMAELIFVANRSANLTGPQAMHSGVRIILTVNAGLVSACG